MKTARFDTFADIPLPSTSEDLFGLPPEQAEDLDSTWEAFHEYEGFRVDSLLLKNRFAITYDRSSHKKSPVIGSNDNSISH